MKIQIGSRTYTVDGTKNLINRLGQNQTWTALKDKKGASVALVETEYDDGIRSELFHLGRKSPWETVDGSTVKR